VIFPLLPLGNDLDSLLAYLGWYPVPYRHARGHFDDVCPGRIGSACCSEGLNELVFTRRFWASHILVHEKLMVDRLDDRLSANFDKSRAVRLGGGPCGVDTGGRSAQWKVGMILTVWYGLRLADTRGNRRDWARLEWHSLTMGWIRGSRAGREEKICGRWIMFQIFTGSRDRLYAAEIRLSFREH
jgi:hypothetical protein